MMNLISQTINRFGSFLQKIQIKSILTTVFLGVILLTSGVNSYATNSNSTSGNIDSRVFEGNPERPTTTREWRKEARKTEGEPLERVKEIGKETAEALKEWGQVYPDVADRTIPDNN